MLTLRGQEPPLESSRRLWNVSSKNVTIKTRMKCRKKNDNTAFSSQTSPNLNANCTLRIKISLGTDPSSSMSTFRWHCSPRLKRTQGHAGSEWPPWALGSKHKAQVFLRCPVQFVTQRWLSGTANKGDPTSSSIRAAPRSQWHSPSSTNQGGGGGGTNRFVSEVWYPFQTQVATNLATRLSKYVPQPHWQEIWTHERNSAKPNQLPNREVWQRVREYI